jgi:predicted DsbA family dithiol-disulfide isomerase
MKITYYLEVTSSWCFWAEPTWSELKKRYDKNAELVWKIALMNPVDFPSTRAQCDWFYRRSSSVMCSSFMLNSAWLEPERRGDYRTPNLVAEAARALGVHDDRARLALSQAGLREGLKIGNLAEAVRVVATATGLDADLLRTHAESPATADRVDASTAEFFALRLTQRPAFLLEDAIGDRAVFSGLVALTPLVATIDAMLADTRAYAAHAAHFGAPPSA